MACARLPLLGGVVLAISCPASLVLAQDVTCYVDSVLGDDAKTGLSEAEAVKTQAKIGKTCTVVRYKRGSVFPEEAVKISTKVKVYANYGDPSLPLPRFEKTRAPNNGSIVSSYQGGITIDGLYMAGSQSENAMSNLMSGVGVMLGTNSKLINSEIADCDIGIMIFGTGTLVQNNYVHDLHVSVDAQPGVDANVVGGAEGIFVNGSNNEVAYNSFVRCAESADWQSGNCDGGATEVSIPAKSTLSGLKIHHNYSYQSCGFFEVSSVTEAANPVKGVFADSEFYNNVSVDSGWLSLLQVSNTDLKNIRWENNTIVQHKGSLRAGMLVAVYTGLGSGMTGGDLLPDVVFWTNNLFVGDGVTFQAPHKNIVQTTTLILSAAKQDPGFVNLAGTAATDFDLLPTSVAVNAGTVLANRTVDYLNRTIPDSSGKPDIGAFEHGGTPTTAPPIPPIGGAGGAPAGTGGSTTVGAGGATAVPKGTGGATTSPRGTGGSTAGPTGTGGSTPLPSGTGGSVLGSGGRSGSGGVIGSGGSTTQPATGAGGSSLVASGGSGSGGDQGSGGTGGGTTETGPAGKNGCSCRLGRTDSGPALWVGLLGGVLLTLRRRARR